MSVRAQIHHYVDDPDAVGDPWRARDPPVTSMPTTPPSKYDQVLDTAELAFVSKGLSKVSMDEVAGLAGVSRAFIYKRFGNRDGLTLAVLTRRAELFNDRAGSFLRAQPTLADAIVEGIMLGVNMALKDTYFGTLVGAAVGDVERPIPGAADAALRYTDALWRPILLDARARGELAAGVEPDDLIEWIMLLMLGLLTQKRALGSSDQVQKRQLRTLLVPAVTAGPHSTRSTDAGRCRFGG